MWLHRLDDADASCGGKAVALARLIAAGIQVPEGFVIDDRAFRYVVGDLDPASDTIGHALAEAARWIATMKLPPDLVHDVEKRAAALGPLAVRSSATIEDGQAGAGAGVFSSRTAVPPAEVWAAIRAVWTSALTPLAVTYARRRGGRIAIGVIVQRFVPGDLVTIYTRPPGAPTSDEIIVQRGTSLERLHRSTDRPAVVLALSAETAIAAGSGTDVEIIEERTGSVASGEQPTRRWLVQARPIVHPVIATRRPAPPSVIAPLVADGRRWTWDVAHNPDPLSLAQAGLVERVERAQITRRSLRVCAGFLYTAPTNAEAPWLVVRTVAAFEAWVSELEAEMRTALAGTAPHVLGIAGRVSLPDAIERYLAFYAIWAGELAPLIAVARAKLSPALLVGARPSAVESTLLAAARGELAEDAVLDRIGVLSPAWDVCVATFAERPELVRAAIDRARGFLGERSAGADVPRIAATEPATETFDTGSHVTAEQPRHELARAAADVAERDDVWFARAQWLVRKAILDRAHELAIEPDDAFWIPLDELASARALDADDVRRRASGARAAAARAAQWAMPFIVGGEPGSDERAAGPMLRGIGSGPRVTGRVVRFETLASVTAVTAGDIVVTRAVTPALAVLVIGCAALVSETGGLLDHGAALARELGIACVVGCSDAWRLPDDAIVTVDGDAGTVEIKNRLVNKHLR